MPLVAHLCADHSLYIWNEKDLNPAGKLNVNRHVPSLSNLVAGPWLQGYAMNDMVPKGLAWVQLRIFPKGVQPDLSNPCPISDQTL